MTEYYSLRGNAAHSVEHPAEFVLAAIRACFGALPFSAGQLTIEASGEVIHLLPVYSSWSGNFSSDGSVPARVNLVDVRRESTPNPTTELASLLQPLCQRLGFELVDHDEVVLVPGGV